MPDSNTVTGRTQDYKIIYSDTFACRTSLTDFHLTFSVNGSVPTNEGIRMAVIEQVTIAMTISMVKLLAINLRRLVDVVEAEAGPIPIVQSAIVPDTFLHALGADLRSNPVTVQKMAAFDRTSYAMKMQ